MTTPERDKKGRGRGFASMSAEKKREIASKGGKAAHALGTAHKWTSEEAQAAGRKGGTISRRKGLTPDERRTFFPETQEVTFRRVQSRETSSDMEPS